MSKRYSPVKVIVISIKNNDVVRCGSCMANPSC